MLFCSFQLPQSLAVKAVTITGCKEDHQHHHHGSTFLFYLPVKPEQTLSDGSITLIPSYVFCATVVTAWIIIHSFWFCAVAKVSSMFSFFSSKQSHFLEQLYECKQINFKPLSSRNSREADFVTDWFDLPLKRKPLTLTLLCSWGIPLMCHIIPTSVILNIFSTAHSCVRGKTEQLSLLFLQKEQITDQRWDISL